MSQLEVDKIVPQSGTTLTIGDSGDTINFADGQNISIDTNTLYIDSTNNRVGIGTTSPTQKLDIDTGHINFSNNYGIDWGGNNSVRGSATDNRINFKTNGSERMRIDSSGRLLIGKTSDSSAVSTEGINLRPFTTPSTFTRDDGTALQVARLTSDGSLIKFYKDGTAVGVIETQNWGIGTSSPQQQLDISSTGPRIRFSDTSVTNLHHVIGSEANDLEIRCDDGNVQADSHIGFKIDGSEKIRIDSSGSLLVGKTSDAFAGEGLVFSPGSASSINRDNGNVISLRRDTSDGNIIQLYKDTTNIGSIGIVNNNNLFIQGDSTNSGLQCGTNNILPVQNGANADNTIDLGLSTIRWKDLYLGGGAYLGGTGTANKLDDYEEGSWTPTASSGVTAVSGSAKYRKVGSLVYVQAYLDGIAGKSANNLIIGGLPFSTTSDGYAIGNIEGGSTSGKMGTARPSSSSTSINFYYPNTSTLQRTNYLGDDVGNFIIFSLTYHTA